MRVVSLATLLANSSRRLALSRFYRWRIERPDGLVGSSYLVRRLSLSLARSLSHRNRTPQRSRDSRLSIDDRTLCSMLGDTRGISLSLSLSLSALPNLSPVTIAVAFFPSFLLRFSLRANFQESNFLLATRLLYKATDRSIRLAELAHSSIADDFLMAALATTDEVASSLCSASIEWGICIATPANRLPTAPTVTLRHVTGRCAPRLRVVAAASRIRAATEAGVLNRSLRRSRNDRRINARISRDEFTTHRAVRIENLIRVITFNRNVLYAASVTSKILYCYPHLYRCKL